MNELYKKLDRIIWLLQKINNKMDKDDIIHVAHGFFLELRSVDSEE